MAWNYRTAQETRKGSGNKKREVTMNKRYDSEFAFRYHRKSIRQPDHNYGLSGTYFITICSERREPVFDTPELRAILRETWEALPTRFPDLGLDEFVIMPDHVHFIVRLEDNVQKPTTLGRIIGAYKSITTVKWLEHIKGTGMECPGIIWQRGYHDHAIRDVRELEETRQYIRNNPIKLQQGQPSNDIV
jgi:putative transposase